MSLITLMLIILCSTCENYVSGFTSTSTTSIRILPSIIKQINQQKQQQGRAHFYNSDNFLSSTRKRQTTRIYATNTNKDNDNFNDDETSREKNTQILNIDKLTNKADSLLDDKSSSEEAISTTTTTTTTSTSTKIENRRQGNVVVDVVDQEEEEEEEESPMNRRIFFGSALVGTSALVAGVTATQSMVNAQQQQQQQASIWSATGALKYESTPVNKRTGVTVFDAENAGYNVRFVTYLSRFLLVFDRDCQRWWYARAQDIPVLSTADQVEAIRLKQFGAFAASVEVGLQEYESGKGKEKGGKKAAGTGSSGGSSSSSEEGPARLMKSLLARYCQTIEALQEKRERKGLPPMTEQEEAKERREIKEARRQIALLFGLLESTQPVEALNVLLSSIDNGSIASVTIQDGGKGYAPGYGPPRVEFPPPKAGDDYQTAMGRAIIKPNGQILRFDLENRGFGYSPATPPAVVISAPGEDRGIVIPGAKAATAKAFVYKSGLNKGRLEKILIQESGFGYMEGEKIRVAISPPELEAGLGGMKATANAILEYSVTGIEITNPGTGYAVEKQIPVYVDPPPLTARVNLNDPLMARTVDPTKPLPGSARPTPTDKGRIASATDSSDPNTFTYRMNRLASNNGKGGGGGCIGRACYDNPVIAFATAKAESSSFTTFRNENDARKIIEDEQALIRGRAISATTGGADSQLPIFWNGGPSSSSGQLLTLLPPGLGLEYDSDLKRFVLSASSDYIDINQGSPLFGGSTRPLDPEFGPRGRSPIDREVQLDFSSYLRFCVSGAICASGVHLMVTPLDVIKTKVQTDPKNYPGPISSFQKLVKEQGLGGFFTGWVPTFVGFFFWGGFSYSLTELIRRYLIIYSGPQAQNFEIQIILVSSAVAAFFGSFVLVPFESVRIRSVAQPGYGKNFFDVTSRIVNEEGIESLFSAAPAFLLKEVPFAMAKFTVFTIVTRYLYDAFPAAQEDIQLSLLVSLVGGIFGGALAAVVSNPADATISEMKKSVSDMTPIDAAKRLIEKGGYSNLMRGLPMRIALYPIVVSTQFLIYDAIRIYLGVGADDLKVYLDVLGGALQGEGGPA
jgi:solute carrier family 25 phosphate transporter 3